MPRQLQGSNGDASRYLVLAVLKIVAANEQVMRQRTCEDTYKVLNPGSYASGSQGGPASAQLMLDCGKANLPERH